MDDIMTLPGGPLGTVTGVLLIFIGILALIFPALVFSLLVIFLAFFAIITSLELIRSGISGPTEADPGRTAQVIVGILGILIAIILVIAPYFMAIAAKVIFAVWAILTGAGNFISVFRGGAALERGLNALFGIILLACGLMILVAPALIADYILILILAIVAIITGIVSIWFARAPVEEERQVNHNIYK